VFRHQGSAALTKKYGVKIRDERRLLKHDPSILQRYAVELDLLIQLLAGGNVVVTDPEQLGSIPSGRSHQRELLHQVSHYGIDTNDALILMEASRLSVRSILTMDGDRLRARAKFDILAWL